MPVCELWQLAHYWRCKYCFTRLRTMFCCFLCLYLLGRSLSSRWGRWSPGGPRCRALPPRAQRGKRGARAGTGAAFQMAESTVVQSRNDSKPREKEHARYRWRSAGSCARACSDGRTDSEIWQSGWLQICDSSNTLRKVCGDDAQAHPNTTGLCVKTLQRWVIFLGKDINPHLV